MSEAIDTRAVAQMLGLSMITVYKMRRDGKGPPFLRFGRTIRYRRADVEAWMASRVATQ